MIWDAYEWTDRRAVWEALQRLLPRDGEHWSRQGLYAYWDPATHEMLYTGLATNLPERFAQHNGLMHHSGGNKLAKITAWFGEQRRLGLSVMLQAAGVEFLDEIGRTSVTLGVDTDDIIKAAEGQVIELHRLERGRWPAWNGVGGGTGGQGWATESARSVIRVLTAETDSLFVARRTIRDLAVDQSAQAHEVTIQSGRIHALMAAHGIGVQPFDREEASQGLLRVFMLRGGHLVEDLSSSDAQIVDRLRQIEDGRVLCEYTAMREMLENMIPRIKIAGDLEAARMLYASALRAELDQAAASAAVSELFRSGYLGASPRLTVDPRK